MRTWLASLSVAVLVAACGPEGLERLPTPTSSDGAPTVSEELPLAHAARRDLHPAFTRWHMAYASAPSAALRARLEAEGIELAKERRAAMAALIAADPERAVAAAMSPVDRTALPPSVAQHVERWRDGIGTLSVLCAFPAEDQPSTPLERLVRFDGDERDLRASVYGVRATHETREGVRLHGVELDGLIALTDSPVRPLFDGERAEPALEEITPLRLRPGLSSGALGGPAPGAAPLLHAGDSYFRDCTEGCTRALAAELFEEETHRALARSPVAAESWTQGTKSVLFIRVDFSDLAGDPISETAAKKLVDETVTSFFQASSYGQTAFTATVTPTLRMTRTSADYKAADDYRALMTDARAAAKAAGFDTAGFPLDVIGFKRLFGGGWAGRAYVGSKGLWLNGYFDLRVTGHEFGHNVGSHHANYWNAGTSVIGTGTSVEYGNPLDIMGDGTSNAHHFNVSAKRRFNWLAPDETATVETSGTYRVFALEQAVDGGALHGLKVLRGDSQAREYWVEFRPGFNNAQQKNGASLHFRMPSASQSQLLDVSPEGDRASSALLLGRTLADPIAGLYFTPVAKNGTVPESLDVVVNRGTFEGNRAPVVSLAASSATVDAGTVVTFTATASDPDGDALAYGWDLDDGSIQPNAPVVSRTLAAARVHSVRCTVSDMKGKTATASISVTVGTPTKYTLAGTVLTSGGLPLEGVRVTDGTRATRTASDGTYLLTEVPAGSFTVSASAFGYTLARGFAAPLAVSASLTGLDFTATPDPGYGITGTVWWGSTGLAGVVVSDGVRSTTTNASGSYTLSNVPNGRWTLTATKPGWTFVASGSATVDIYGGGATVSFSATGNYVSGRISSASATAPTVSDGVRTVTATPLSGGSTGGVGQPSAGADGGSSGLWSWSLSAVPSGTWNLVALAPGRTLVPSTFANPVTLPQARSTSLDFVEAGDGGVGVRVSGSVRTGSTPLPGALVTDGTRSSTTDSQGRYVLVGVPPGNYTLTPSAGGYTFVPVTRSVSVSSVDVTGQDFATTAANLSPTVANPAVATPGAVAGGTSAQLSVRGDDDSGEAALTYTWTSTLGGGVAPTFSANGTHAARDTVVTFGAAGSYTLEALITDPGGLSVRSSVVVVVSQSATSLAVTPTTASVPVAGTQLFQVSLKDQFGRTMFAGNPLWTLSGGGTLTNSGAAVVFTAGTSPSGPHTVTASLSGKSATASVTVTGSGAPTIVTPATATPARVTGDGAALSVRASDAGGEAALRYTWSVVSGPTGATFAPNDDNAAKDTSVTFAEAGEYVLEVRVLDADGQAATSRVTVRVDATPTRVRVDPTAVLLRVGETQRFSAEALDQFGNALSPQPELTWTVTGGGTVDAAGLFQASASGGPFTLTATSGALAATATITVGERPDTAPPVVSLSAPTGGQRLVSPVRLEATASDETGVARVEFYVDGAKRGEVSTPPYVFTLADGALAPGTHRFWARAVDAAGNAATSDVVEASVAGAPVDGAAPSVRLTSPRLAEVTSLAIVLTADASDDVGVTRVDFEIDGVDVGSSAAAPWTYAMTVPAGSHLAVAVAHDASGRFTRSEAVSFVTGGGAVDGGSAGGAGPGDAGAGGATGTGGPGAAGADARRQDEPVLGALGLGCSSTPSGPESPTPWSLLLAAVAFAGWARRREGAPRG